MRVFWRLFVILLIATSLFFSWPSIVSNFLSDRKQYSSMQSGPPDGSKIILSYPLSNESWVEFSLLKNDQQLKVVTNAELPLNYQSEVGERWQYSIEYELLDRAGKTIKSGDIYHKTGQLIFYDEQKKQNYVSAVYYPADVNPVDARLHLLNLRGFNDANKIRIRLKSLGIPLVGLVARIYRQKNISQSSLQSEWQRLSEDKKNNLSRASIYQKELLREAEKQILIANQWSPLGPLGIKGKDYESRKLYVMRDVEEDVIINLPLVPPNGLQVFPDVYGVVRIPVFSGNVKLTWQGMEPLDASDHVNIEWWGHPSTRYQKWTENTMSGSFSQNLDSGVIQVSTSKHIVLKVWVTGGIEQQLTEITPDTRYVRLYKSSGKPIAYQINHIDNNNSPFKIILRTYEEIGEQSVRYHAYDKDEQLILSGKLYVTNQKSDYDRVNLPDAKVISDPSDYYFNLPESVKRFEVIADETVWVAAYTRPLNLSKLSRYPYKLENATNKVKSPPAWYFMRPSGWKELVAKGRSILLSIQPRPPELDPVLLAGQYRWENFLPQGNWRGRELLVPFKNELISPTVSTENQFRHLNDTDSDLTFSTQIELKGVEGEEIVSPELIFRQKRAGKLVLKLWLEDKLYLEQTVYSRDGKIQLEPVSKGKYKLRVTLDKHAEILMDHLANVKTGYNKRTAIRLTNQPLIFNYVKQNSEELLALRIYGKRDETSAQNISIKIGGYDKRLLGPFKSWTIKDRDYILEAADGDVASVLSAKQNLLGPAKLIFIKLGDDMPKNKNYTVEVNINQGVQGDEGYMIMTRTLPGVFETRKIRSQKRL